MQIIDQPVISVLGSGSWGTALALLLARNGCHVQFWGRQAEAILKTGENTAYFPGVPLLQRMKVCGTLEESIQGTDDILLAVPCVAFASVVEQIKSLNATKKIVWASKGLDHKNAQLLSSSLDTIWPELKSKGVISGPSFAAEVLAKKPSAVNVAGNDPALVQFWCRCLSNEYFRAYPSDDLVGVQLGGAVKNVIAIAAGISDGMGLGANARCALITKGLSEMSALGVAMGASSDTFMDLAGIGDLMLTATDDQSRNRRFGLALGAGMTLDEAEISVGQVVEGKVTALCVQKLALQHEVDMPIVARLVAMLMGEKRLHQDDFSWFLS